MGVLWVHTISAGFFLSVLVTCDSSLCSGWDPAPDSCEAGDFRLVISEPQGLNNPRRPLRVICGSSRWWGLHTAFAQHSGLPGGLLRPFNWLPAALLLSDLDSPPL